MIFLYVAYDVNIWQNIFKIWFLEIYCSEFVDFFSFFFHDFPLLLNLPKFLEDMICFTILFTRMKIYCSCFLNFPTQFCNAFQLAKTYNNFGKKFISLSSMTWNQSCIFFLLFLTIQYTLFLSLSNISLFNFLM